MQGIFYIGRFLRFMLQRFIEDRGTHSAGVLAYTSLLSLVPLMAVGLSFLAIVSDFKGFSEDIQHFIFSNFVPAAGEVVKEHVQQFASKASRMSAVGLGVLVVTVLMMMATVDSTLNRIWRVRARRSRMASFLVYGAVLTWGPILVGGGIAATSYLVSLPLISEATSPFGGRQMLLSVMPYALETIAFTLLYLVVPNRRVVFWHAVAGGVLAAVLFELAKRGFAVYVTTFPTYEAIYGALAAIPLFLVWVYVSWLVVLLGAEFACCLDVYRDHMMMSWESHTVKFVLAFRLVGYLWQAQQRGEGLLVRQLLKQMPTVDEESLREVLDVLHRGHFVERMANRRWMLARDLDTVTLLDLYRCGGFALPEPEGRWLQMDGWSQRLGAALIDIERRIDDDMDVSLRSLYQTAEEVVEVAPQASMDEDMPAAEITALYDEDEMETAAEDNGDGRHAAG